MITESITRKIGNVDVVEITGRLDFGNALAAIEESIMNLIELGSRRMVIHVPGLTAIDSAGVGMLMACNGHMDQKGGKLRIAGAHGGVARTFEVVHLDRLAPLDADLATACRALDQG